MDKEPGKRLRLIRQQEGKTTYEMAVALGLPQATYSKYENGYMSIRVDVLKNLYVKFGALPHYITTGIGPKYERKEEKKSQLITDLSALKAEQLAMKANLDYIISRRVK